MSSGAPSVTPSLVEHLQSLPTRTPEQEDIVRYYTWRAAQANSANLPPAPPSPASTAASVVSARLRRRGVSGLGDLTEFARTQDLSSVPPDRRAFLQQLAIDLDKARMALRTAESEPASPAAVTFPAAESASSSAPKGGAGAWGPDVGPSTSSAVNLNPAAESASSSAPSVATPLDDDLSSVDLGQLRARLEMRLESQGQHYEAIVNDELEVHRLYWAIKLRRPNA
ncbi:hypothetical protein QBC39DRAFT_360335 [Podospora conica]|nr:hypothetical protein QBC39DRAFT_360335 [Schizothecium conicum]